MASSAESRLARKKKHARSPLFAGYAHICERLALLWLHRLSALYGKLCLNAIREVSSYLWFKAKLLAFHENRLLSFDIDTGSTRVEYESDAATKAVFRLFGAVCVGDNTAFVVADLDGYCTFMLENRTKRDLPTLLRERFGLFYDSDRHRVCVFGGRRRLGPFGRAYKVRECEQLRFDLNKWQSLGQMRKQRENFHPCLHKSLVYLCGFWEKSVETFDPRSDSFALIPELALPIHSFPYSERISLVSVADEVILFGADRMMVLDPEKRQAKERMMEGFFTQNGCIMVVREGWVYYADEENFQWSRAELRSGKIEGVDKWNR